MFKALGSLPDPGCDRLAPARVPLLLPGAKQGMGFSFSCPATGAGCSQGLGCPHASDGEGEPAG